MLLPRPTKQVKYTIGLMVFDWFTFACSNENAVWAANQRIYIDDIGVKCSCDRVLSSDFEGISPTSVLSPILEAYRYVTTLTKLQVTSSRVCTLITSGILILGIPLPPQVIETNVYLNLTDYRFRTPDFVSALMIINRPKTLKVLKHITPLDRLMGFNRNGYCRQITYTRIRFFFRNGPF